MQIDGEVRNLRFEERKSGHDLGISFGLIPGRVLCA
jgi:hypothetical protein